MLSLNHLCNSNYGKNYPELKYAIVTFGNIMAYLPSSEYSWGRDNNLKNKLKLGTE